MYASTTKPHPDDRAHYPAQCSLSSQQFKIISEAIVLTGVAIM